MQTRNLVLALGILVATGCSRISDREGPLQVQVPAGWTLEFEYRGNIPVYTIAPPDHSSALNLSRPPQTAKPADIPELVQRLGEGFVMVATNAPPGFKLLDEKVTVEILAGEQFKGNYTVVHYEEGNQEVTHCLFMVSDGGPIWGGQFIGTREGWVKAIEVLKTLRIRNR